MLSLLLATLLTQATMSPSSDLSANRTMATGSTAYRSLRDRFADTINAKDFGALGNGSANDTSALQAAINVALSTGRDLLIPSGVYRFTSLTVSLSGAARGFRVRGATSGDLTGARGSVLESTAASGAAITVTGGMGNANVIFEGVTFKGNANLDNGVVISEAWNLTFRDCVFLGFSKSGSAAAKITMGTGTFAGLLLFDRCQWESNAVGVWELPTSLNQVNVVRYVNSRFMDSTEAAIKIGASGLLMQGRSHSVSHCDFEGNYQDIVALGAVYGFTIDGASYFENNTAGSPPRISMTTGVKSLVIEGNFFQHDPGAAGTVIHLSSVEGASIRRNFSAFGNQTDRSFVGALVAGSMDVDRAQAAPGIASYPNRISVGGASDAVAYYDPVMWETTGSIMWGSGAPSDAKGRLGDLWIQTDSAGSRGAIWVRRTAHWRQLQNNDRSVVVPAGAYIPVNAALADSVRYAATTANTYTFLAPTNPSEEQALTFTIVNDTVSTLGTTTWAGGAGGYVLSSDWVNPATSTQRSIQFKYNGEVGGWFEQWRSGEMRNVP